MRNKLSPELMHTMVIVSMTYRYWTPEIEALLAELNEIEEQRDAALKDTMRCLFNSFDQQ